MFSDKPVSLGSNPDIIKFSPFCCYSLIAWRSKWYVGAENSWRRWLVHTHTCSVAHLFLCNYTITRLVRNVGWLLYSTPPLEEYIVQDRTKTETEFSNHSVTPQFLQFTLLAITGVQREIMGTGIPTYVTGVFHLNCVTSYSRIFQFIHLHTNFPH